MQNNHSLEDQIYANRAFMWRRFTKLSAWGCAAVILLLLFLIYVWPGV